MVKQIERLALVLFNKEIKDLSEDEVFIVLINLVKSVSKEVDLIENKRKLYYLSSEFLLGRMLINNLINLDIYDEVKSVLEENNFDLARIDNLENEPSLGNGGLGRLAACFIDSISTLGMCGEGVSLFYHFGLFKQTFENNIQVPQVDSWISDNSLFEKSDVGFEVKFNNFSVNSVLYNLDIIGYKGKKNKLRLFDVVTVDENLIDHNISYNNTDIMKSLTFFVYPDDTTREGKLLRIHQQYFLVSNAVQLMLKDNSNIKDVEIQINDTHPTLVILELIYQLTQRDMAYEDILGFIATNVSFTNHTILREGLEKWPLDYINEVVPHLSSILYELDRRVKEKNVHSDTYIIDNDNLVHMANICSHYVKSINGVAKLHTEILKSNVLKEVYHLYPEKFNNKTNGITFRRWLKSCNNELYTYLNDLLDIDSAVDYDKLINLLTYQDDLAVLTKLGEIKQNNKLKLKQYLIEKEDVVIDVDSVFDIQVKRIHEYKRQQLNALFIIHTYLNIKKGILPSSSITFIFSGKAAPAYIIAQDVIHLLLTLKDLINSDEVAKKYINIVFVSNYNVSVAEKLIPAADISEQISLASKEASGTGNMKLMLNGAVTIGTMDGANVEIANLVGSDSIYTFGKSAEYVIDAYNNNSYHPWEYYNEEHIKEVIDFIICQEMLKLGNATNLYRLHDELINKDWFMTLLDFNEYISIKTQCINDYSDKNSWNKKVLVNIANAGNFSTDRTIEEYNNDIWHLDKS